MSPLESFTVWDLGMWLAIASAVLVVAVAAVRLSTRTGLPSLLIYLLIGVGLGPEGLGLEFQSMSLTRVLGYLALALILAEGGLTTDWSDIRSSVAPAALLSTVGVGVSVVVVAVAAHLLIGIDWQIALLLGAILASTDAAAVFSVLRSVPLPRRLTGILEAESGFNDAPVVLVVVALSAQAAGQAPQSSVGDAALLLVVSIVGELVGGALIGVATGWLGARVMRLLVSGHSGIFPIGVYAWAMLAYGLASVLHTSGFIAVYLAGLLLGNQQLPHRAATRGFAQASGWLAQIGLFVMLGMLTTPTELIDQLLPAVVLGLVLLVVARPVSVFASCTFFGLSWREQLFLSWAGLRGAVPIVLATVPFIAGVPGVSWLFDLVFVLVLVFTVVQGPTLPWVARRLHVTERDRAHTLEVETTPLEEVGADLLEVSIGEESRLHGIELFELRLPVGAQIALVVRDRTSFVPTPNTALRRGDRMIVVAAPGTREQTEHRLHAVDLQGRLAGWHRTIGAPDGRKPPVRGGRAVADGPDRPG
ncbi:cell volume regulation protein A [Austwickia chelonae]|uniref:Putative sodium/proton antiporter n=1 Tax=Austwickia chelonae NBRC 105200 TaxID=1184607 RepID=K6W812_9MICO|nr:potassium/proton antiporter [Austwickia chelonae]GAB77977.1 putative sodium/proton antiporter [Austwickia chelonae NBRC 105200]SEV93518.1 cell volume regulation protein A [Austwickia chelonae]